MSENCVIQVTNIAPSATNEQMKTLFSHLGTIKEIVVYPNEDSALSPTSRVCYIRFADSWSVGVAQHLTNTVFVDRALIVLPVDDGKIPDAMTAMNLTSGGPLAGGSNSGVVSQVITGVGGAQVITTIDPRLTALGLPQYPPLPANMDPTKIEEIRRTVYVGNLDSTLSAEQLLTFFNQIGEVKYIRMAGDETQPTRFAFVEFTDQSSVANALQYNGVIFGGRPLKINHSNNSIVKPQAKSSEVAQKEIEEAMKRVREAQSLISAAIEPGFSMKILDYSGKDKSKSRSRSRSRRSTSRTRRRSRSRTRRSRSKERRRRSRSHSTEKRTRDWRSRSHERRRSRSRDRRHRRRSRSRDKEEIRSRRRSRSRDRDKSKRKHSRSRSRSKRGDDQKTKEIEKSKEKSVSELTEIESKPEGPELPPEDIKSEQTESEVRSQSTPSEIAKSPRKSISVSPPRKYRRSRSPKKRSRSKERKRSRTPSKSHKKKRSDRDRERDRERDKDRDKDRSHSRDRKDRKKKRRDREDSSDRLNREMTKIKRDYDEEEKGYDSKEDEKRYRHSSRDKTRKVSLSPD